MSDQIEPTGEPVASVQVNSGGQHFTPMGNPQVYQADPESIQATLRSPSGSRLIGDITDDCRITVEGVEMTLAQAKQHGLVNVDQNAQVIEANRPEPFQPEAGPDEALEVDAETVETLENWAGAIEAYTGSGQNTYTVVSEFMNNPDQLPPLMTTMVEQNGQDPGAFHAEAKRVASVIEASLHDRVRSFGIDPTAFGDFVRSSHKADDLNRAVMEVVISGNMEPLNGLIDFYRRHSPPQDDPHASVSVVVNGQRIETTVANAKRNGWL